MKETQIIRLPLQYFAEGEGAGTETEGGSEGNGDNGEKVPTFDDILKDKSMQAEFDRRVSKAMEKQKATLTEEFGKTLEEKLSEAKKLGAGMLSECDAAIAVFADSKKADTWIEDCSIAMSFMHLMAAEQGVGSCWVQIHLRSSSLGTDAEAGVRTVLSVPEHYRIVGILALGMPAKESQPHTLEDLDQTKIH